MLQSEAQNFKHELAKPNMILPEPAQGVSHSSRVSPRKAKESKKYLDHDFEDFTVGQF